MARLIIEDRRDRDRTSTEKATESGGETGGSRLIADGGVDVEQLREEAEDAIEDALQGGDKEAADIEITDADIEAAHDVVLENSIETTDFVRFRSLLLEEGFDANEIPEVWAILKNEGKIPKGTRQVPSGEPAQEEDDDDEPDHEHAGPDIDSVGDLEAQFEGAEGAYLLKTSNCPTCMQAEEALDPWIEEGVLTPLNFPESPKAEEIVDALGIREVPTLVAEVADGQYREL